MKFTKNSLVLLMAVLVLLSALMWTVSSKDAPAAAVVSAEVSESESALPPASEPAVDPTAPTAPTAPATTKPATTKVTDKVIGLVEIGSNLIQWIAGFGIFLAYIVWVPIRWFITYFLGIELPELPKK